MESIKPSSPTPYYFKSFKLSLVDQLVPPTYVPIVLFYVAFECDDDLDYSIICTRLKNSLLETLTLFYPLDGMIKVDVSIDLSYEVVTFAKAQASIQLSYILNSVQKSVKSDTTQLSCIHLDADRDESDTRYGFIPKLALESVVLG